MEVPVLSELLGVFMLETCALVTDPFRTAEMWQWDLSVIGVPRGHLLAGLWYPLLAARMKIFSLVG